MNKELKSESQQNLVIGITLGDINGIGPEVVIKALVSLNKLTQLSWYKYPISLIPNGKII